LTGAYLQSAGPSESQLDQIDFKHAIYSIIIFPF
jgi:hypothetical protein